MKAAFLVVIVFISRATAQICCSPPQFQTVISTDDYVEAPNTKVMTKIQIKLSYDYTNKRIRIDENPAGIKTTVITDFIKHKSYIVTNGQCLTAAIDAPFNPTCVPGTASFSGILQLGGPGGIVAKSYYFSTADGSVQTNYIISEDCIPILEVAKASLIKPITETTFVALAYGNTTLGIKDPSIFDIPANCPQEASLNLPTADVAVHLHRKRRASFYKSLADN